MQREVTDEELVGATQEYEFSCSSDISDEEFYEATQLVESSLLPSCTWNDSAASMEDLTAPVSHSSAAKERIHW